jgi:hypothetical protein
VEVLNNRDLSQIFWIDFLGMPLPRAAADSPWYIEILTIVKREIVGIALLAAYFIILPPVLATTMFRKAFVKMGFLRYMLMSNLFLFMLTLPLKMVLRWTINLKYIVHIDEWFLNF